MIKNFIHKGLRKFYASGSTAGIQKNHEKKLRLILAIKRVSDRLFRVNDHRCCKTP